MLIPYSSQVAPYRRFRRYGFPSPAGAAGYSIAAEAGRRLYNYYSGTPSGRRVAAVAASAPAIKPVSKKMVKKPRRPRTLKKQVKDLQKQMNDLNSHLTVRYHDAFRLLASQNATGIVSHVQNDTTTIELALNNLRYYDPSNPGTLLTASGTAGTYLKKYQMKSSYVYNFRNNYQIPVQVKIYKYTVKVDTSIPPSTAFTNGLADIGNPTSSSVIVYPSDSPQLKALWVQKSVITWSLKPGQEKVYSLNSSWFDYDASLTDSHGDLYQKPCKCTAILIRIQGVPSHDKTTNTQLGLAAAGIDYTEKITMMVKYNSGGPDIKYLVVADNVDSMTAGPVVSQVVVDNQEYSAT